MKRRLRSGFGERGEVRITRACSGRHSAPPLIADNSGGKIYIVGQILDDSRMSPAEAMGFNLTFIGTYDAGESYTEQEHRDWLRQAGFVDIERANSLLPDNLSVMTARKSKNRSQKRAS